MKTYLLALKLKFNPALEDAYQSYFASKDKQYIRIAFILFAVLFGLFSITDYILVPERFTFFLTIRFFVVIPVLILTILLTYHDQFYKYKQAVLSLNYMIGGGAIVVMLVLEPMNVIYYGGLFLVFTSGYFMIDLNTKYAMISGFMILSTFLLGILITRQMNVTIFSVTLFLLAENIIGGLGAYQLERYKRREFLNIHQLNASHVELNATVIEKAEELLNSQMATIYALAKLAESRDLETGEHIERVGKLCFKLANMLPLSYYESYDQKIEFVRSIQIASALHDIGKVGIADSILNKPGPLNDSEIQVMRTHTRIGRDILRKLHEQYPNNIFVNLGIEITSYHHEKWDGTGYPNHLKGIEIPLSARIMAIVDVYDALVSKRPYKEAFSHEKALAIISNDSGKHFDPDLVAHFLNLFIQSKDKY